VDWADPTLAAARQRSRSRFGSEAYAWWDALPAVADGLTDRWGFTRLELIDHRGSAVVLRCATPSGRSACLKLVPDLALAAQEQRALEYWSATQRVPAVFAADASLGALLLEALDALPASTAPAPVDGSADPADAISLDEVADLLNDLRGAAIETDARPGADPAAPAPFPPLTDRIDFLWDLYEQRRAGDPVRAAAVPREEFAAAHLLATELAETATDVRLVHGDLHPGNVMRRGERLVAIDPRACLGDPAFDLVDWVVDPSDDPDAWRQRAASLAAATALDADRVWQWCRALAPLLAISASARGTAAAPRLAALRAITT
jgi:streptomycin 6-kinase